MSKGPAILLLSGGLDSALNLAMAARDGVARFALTMAYGQRAEAQELKAAEALARHYDIPWKSVDLRWLSAAHGNALTRAGQALPDLATADLDDMAKATESAKAVWVANRNGLFLNTAAVFAEAMGLGRVLVGFNREEAATFPDNSQAFMEAATKSLSFSTMNSVAVDSYSIDWDKTRIVREAIAVGLPLELVWSCYEAGEVPCGNCESCRRFARARRNAL